MGKWGPNVATKNDLIEHCPNPKKWTVVKPNGLHIVNKAISKNTACKIKAKMLAPSFPWVQRFKRFPKTAHFNFWRIGPFVGDEQQRTFADEHPEIYALCNEAVASMNAKVATDDPNSTFCDSFVAESVSVHLHKPNWGLGAHYDDAHDEGVGKVLMVSLGTEKESPKETRKPRTFLFTDPVFGRQFPVSTPSRQAVLFEGDCYDFWRHESVRDKRQTGDCLSFTIRLKSVDGYVGIEHDLREYPRGAPPAEAQAHKRLRAKHDITDRRVESPAKKPAAEN
tara:strand:- start:697 stop:1539 length:843 start_codon:yes stop_codon:yes gene_type:complete